jgi:hypothetical protein
VKAKGRKVPRCTLLALNGHSKGVTECPLLEQSGHQAETLHRFQQPQAKWHIAVLA